MSHENLSELINRLGELAPIAALPLERREEIARLCTLDSYSPNQGEIELDGWAGQVVYLLTGEAKLSYADGGFDVLVGGADSARHPLRSANRNLRACKPITDVELLRLDAEMLDLILAWDQSSNDHDASNASDATDWRMMSGMFAIQNLARGAFASLPAANISRLRDRFARIEVRRGDVILREDEPGDYYYLIESGRCTITRKVGGADMEIADLKPGDAFGEEALLSNATRNATVTMKTNGALMRLSKSDFFELLSEPLLNRIDWKEANLRVANGAQWVDVRYPAEFVRDGLPGAINIPLNEVRRSVQLLDAGREYVAYCQSGRRSSAAAFLFSQRGLRASVLAGGFHAFNTISPESVSQ